MSCGARPLVGNSFCNACGAKTNSLAEICVTCGAKLSQTGQPLGNVSPKSRAALSILAFFLGELGIHRFYVGKIGTGIAMLLLAIIGYSTLAFFIGIPFLVVLGIWNLIDFIMAVVGNFKDKEGKKISNW